MTNPSVLPLSARARQIADELGVSIVVAGSSAVTEFIPIADTVFRIQDGHLEDITAEAKGWGIQPLNYDLDAAALQPLVEKSRWVVPSSLDGSRGRHDWVIRAHGSNILEFDRYTIDLSGIVQLAELDQTETIGRIIQYAKMNQLPTQRPAHQHAIAFGPFQLLLELYRIRRIKNVQDIDLNAVLH